MQVGKVPHQKLIERTMEATDKAIEMIREADFVRRNTALELRDMQISMHEDYERIRSMIHDSDRHVYAERVRNAQYLEQRAQRARATADMALSSVLMVSDVQALEKKAEILKDSVTQLNKAYYHYEHNVDMQDLMDQVTEMLYRVEKKEQDALDGRATDEKSVEQAFRAAVEGLYGLQSSNPKIVEEAKQLAAELRVFRDAAANNNFHNMISKSEEEKESVSKGKECGSSSKETSAESPSSSQMTV